MNKFVAAIQKVFGRLANRVATEPVFLATLAMAGLDAYQKAQTQGLGFEDAIIFAIYVVVGLLARELVWPAVKVDAATGAAKAVDTPLDPPYLGEQPE